MLKSLELFGFKSFADRTLFEFAPGITCVVGPNGSGKSNVVDAMKWILGDQSAKSLRGKEMSDVIFNGSAQRRSSGFAEATLTFDNADGLLPLETDQVSVGRRLYQSGDSEYLLNGSPVRLKDIRDMFMGTGAGTAAYSIIEQGRVDQILQSNPTARRAVFEEAAGISKFKARKEDAERRLERVAQNLLRLTDIVDQVESQLKATRSQATKAARYRELSIELKEKWTGLAADDCRFLTGQLDAMLDETESVDQLEAELQEELAALSLKKSDVEHQLSEIDEQYVGYERGMAAIRQTIASHQSTIRHQHARGQELTKELSRSRRQRFELLMQIEFAAQEIDGIQDRLTQFQDRFAQSKSEVEVRSAELEEITQRAGEKHRAIADLQHQRDKRQKTQAGHQEQLAAQQSQIQSLEQTLERQSQRQHAISEQLEVATQERQARKTTLTDAEAELRVHQHRLTEKQTQQLQLAEQRDQTERQLADFRERRSAAEARLALLTELEKRQDGISLGVRDILQRAESSHYPPWNQVIGLVRDLIDVPMESAPVLEAVLAERAQLIAVRRLQPFLDYLNKGAPAIDGRVGFISLERCPTSPPENAGGALPQDWDDYLDLSSEPGVDGRADLLVTERSDAAGIARRILGDTWVVETLDVARRLIEEVPQHVRFVTRQGELLCGREQLFVGVMPHELSIVSRRSELRQLKNEIHQLNRNIEACQERQTILAERIEAGLGELTSVESDLKDLTTAVTRATSSLAEQDRELSRLEKEYTEQLSQHEQSVTQFESLKENAQATQDLLGTLQSEMEELAQTLATELQAKAEFERTVGELSGQIKGAQLELAKHESQLANLQETQERLVQSQQQRTRQREQLDHRLLELRDAMRKSDHEILTAQSHIAEAALELDQLIGQSRSIVTERDSLRQQRREFSREEDGLQKRLRKQEDRHRHLEFEIQKSRHQLTTMGDRIQEEYQLSLEDLLESNLSAYQQYLAEHYAPIEEDAPEIENLEESVAGEESEDGPGADSVEDSSEQILEEAGDTEVASEELDGEDQDIEDSVPEVDSPEDGGLTKDRKVDVPSFEEVRDELEADVDRLRRKIKAIGNVNTDALDSLDELETRYATLSSQLEDLQMAKSALEDIIRRINHESERIFITTFETIRGHFQELFRKLFGGGNADIVLEDPENVLDCGIDIVARPPGKELRSISLLSGGEKTMTAVAMLFAMFKSKPSPYCVLDEVDAALDDANVDRYVTVIKEFVSMTQFIVITHRKRTMTAADVLYGVTMEQAGVSKRISVSFDDVSDNGEIRNAA